MTAETEDIRAEVMRQAVILVFGVATLVLYTIGQRYLTGPDAVDRARARLSAFRPAHRDLYAEWLPGVQREISRMEHSDGS